MSRTSLRTRLVLCVGLLLSSASAGCESGKEVAAVKAATASLDPQDRITVTAELSCAVVWGQPRASGCDADDSTVCLRANWYDATDTGFQRSLFEARACGHIGSIQGATMQATSDGAIPKAPPLKIRLQTEPSLDSRDTAPPPVVIDNP